VETWIPKQILVERHLVDIAAKGAGALTVPFLVPALFAVAHTAMLATRPPNLTNSIGHISGSCYAEAPKELKSFPYFMTWHPRLTSDPAHSWLREKIRQAARAV